MPMLLPPNEYINIETREDDADLRIYHSKMRLVDDWAHIEAYKGVIGVDAQTAMPSMLEFALGIDGVTWCRVTAHTLLIRKSPIFQWNAIDDKLLDAWMGIVALYDESKVRFQEEPIQ